MFHDPDFMPFEPAIRRAGPLDYHLSGKPQLFASVSLRPKKGLPLRVEPLG
jgi:hypothetical protein